MKTAFVLDQAELSQAVADFVAKKLGRDVKVDVKFNVSALYDFHDRPTGNHTIVATVTFGD